MIRCERCAFMEVNGRGIMTCGHPANRSIFEGEFPQCFSKNKKGECEIFSPRFQFGPPDPTPKSIAPPTPKKVFCKDCEHMGANAICLASCRNPGVDYVFGGVRSIPAMACRDLNDNGDCKDYEAGS